MKSEEVQEQWNKLINITTKVAVDRYGSFFRKRMIDETGINKNKIGRFFKKKKMSRFDTMIAILDTLDLELTIKKKEKIKKVKL